MSGKRKEEARRWFQQAVYDLKAVKWNIEGGFYAQACFLAQQAGEKALKSLLYYLGKRRKALFTHSLVEMVKEGAKNVKEITDLLDQARELDLHYIPSRYPNGLPSGFPQSFYSKKMAKQVLKAAEEIVVAVQMYYQKEGEKSILEPEED